MTHTHDKLTVSKRSHLKPMLKKLIVSAVVCSTLSFGSIATTEAKESTLQTIYHVYMNNEYAGATTDKKIIDSLIEEKIEKLKETYETYDFTVSNEVSYIAEQVFRSNCNNEKILENLKEELMIEAKAALLEIDGEPVAYLENEATAEEVLKTLKLKYVSEEELAFVEKRKESDEELAPLKKDETRLIDVELSRDLEIVESQVSPDKILPVKDALQLLEKGTLEEKKYEIVAGDVLGKIAAAHDLTTKQIMELNKGITDDTILQIGQELNVTEYKPYLEVIVSKEKFQEEKISFEKEVVEDKNMFKGDTKVKQKGKEGLREVTYQVIEKNGKNVEKEVIEENVTKKPVNEITLKGTKVVPSRGTGSLSWPTSGGYVSSTYGYRWGSLHKGIDIARPSNRTITAADNGVVVSAGWDSGYGNKVVINHNNGMRTVYAHLASINVSSGQTVSKGSNIGVMGTTGNSTGVHLHFEVYKNGSLQNPMSYLR